MPRGTQIYKPLLLSSSMESYETLLAKAYENVKVIKKCSERFEIPAAVGQIEGKTTVITNIAAIAVSLRRPIEHIGRFLQKELAVPGRIANERLILNSRLSASKVNEKIAAYTKEFVLCNECGKPDTELVVEKGYKFKHCLACGAKSPVRAAL